MGASASAVARPISSLFAVQQQNLVNVNEDNDFEFQQIKVANVIGPIFEAFDRNGKLSALNGILMPPGFTFSPITDSPVMCPSFHRFTLVYDHLLLP